VLVTIALVDDGDIRLPEQLLVDLLIRLLTVPLALLGAAR